MISLHFLFVIVLVVLGLSAVVFKRNMIKIVMGLNVIAGGVNLFLISMGYRQGAVAPIFTNAPDLLMVLPTPQALTLTAIVINLTVTALMLSFIIMLYKHYRSLDSFKRRLLG
ncbi:MAG: cation:proton antiporter subunit C [Candidatus Aenigmatarchaeota archaeon]|nr:MAG: cation:proton antiporter subunit C [Candidatus Aenigmarchaeota archaeon]